ncbi:MAG: chalcone isomerase family protein [Ignavibacteriae bacterium]|nr:chalcone isomerase family protein [Ignavibacteriota bacterium]
MKTYICIAALLCFAAVSSLAQEKVTEPSTGKNFDSKVSFDYNNTDYTLQLTGVTVRKKMVFKVYGMAHYMQEPQKMSEDAAYKTVLTDGKAKQITMTFVRDVDKQKIQDTYRDGFAENSSAEDLKKIQSAIDQYVGFFTKDVKENDQFVIRWLPGGIISATVQGEQKPAITNQLFAQTLWSIWFGEDSIVDREDLVSRMTAK